MTKSARLLDIMQALRRHRRPVAAATLAQETGVSERTIYRDIATLQGMGADIEGESGVGYILRPGFLLPPLMLSEDEIQALALGAQWVCRQTDTVMARAAADAVAKISAVLPNELRDKLDDNDFHVGRRAPDLDRIDLPMIRLAMREQRKLRIVYRNLKGDTTQRAIWPIAIGFVEGNRFVAGWCELRADFRLFRLDRMDDAQLLSDRYPGRRRQLVARWRALVAGARGDGTPGTLPPTRGLSRSIPTQTKRP